MTKEPAKLRDQIAAIKELSIDAVLSNDNLSCSDVKTFLERRLEADKLSGGLPGLTPEMLAQANALKESNLSSWDENRTGTILSLAEGLAGETIDGNPEGQKAYIRCIHTLSKQEPLIADVSFEAYRNHFLEIKERMDGLLGMDNISAAHMLGVQLMSILYNAVLHGDWFDSENKSKDEKDEEVIKCKKNLDQAISNVIRDSEEVMLTLRSQAADTKRSKRRRYLN